MNIRTVLENRMTELQTEMDKRLDTYHAAYAELLNCTRTLQTLDDMAIDDTIVPRFKIGQTIYFLELPKTFKDFSDYYVQEGKIDMCMIVSFPNETKIQYTYSCEQPSNYAGHGERHPEKYIFATREEAEEMRLQRIESFEKRREEIDAEKNTNR